MRSWMRRIGNARKIKNSKKSLAYQIMRLFEEAGEMSIEMRKADNPEDLTVAGITFKKDKYGIDKPHGFAAEWGDTMNQLLHIADRVGIDPDAAMEIVTSYHETKRLVKPKKTKKKVKK
ncbi:MAG TPA: hypothetical protein VFT30_03050 [Nitrospira sp.]|nr:hypothetical protein [Nitrospira sp.]